MAARKDIVQCLEQALDIDADAPIGFNRLELEWQMDQLGVDFLDVLHVLEHYAGPGPRTGKCDESYVIGRTVDGVALEVAITPLVDGGVFINCVRKCATDE